VVRLQSSTASSLSLTHFHPPSSSSSISLEVNIDWLLAASIAAVSLEILDAAFATASSFFSHIQCILTAICRDTKSLDFERADKNFSSDSLPGFDNLSHAG
jgi:hypothetical protein